MKAFRALWVGLWILGSCLAGNRVVAQTTIILQYKYAVSYADQTGAVNKAVGYLLVETDDAGTYNAGSTPVLFLYDSKAKTFWIQGWALAVHHDVARNVVTASTSVAVLYGTPKATKLAGRYGGFTPFSFSLAHVAPSLQGAECNYATENSWFATKKSTLKLDKTRSVHLIEEGDDSMVDAIAHVKRWLEDKGYTDLTP